MNVTNVGDVLSCSVDGVVVFDAFVDAVAGADIEPLDGDPSTGPTTGDPSPPFAGIENHK